MPRRNLSLFTTLAALLLAMTVPSPAQVFTTLASFDGTDTNDSVAALIQATDGNLYGATVYGGSAGQGTVFKVTPEGTITVLYNFCSLSGCADGANPFAAPILGTDGNLYGTAQYGGDTADCSNGCGTVYQLTLGGTLTTLHTFDGSDGQQPQGGVTAGNDGNFYGNTLYGGSFDWGTLFKISPGGAFTSLHSFAHTHSDGATPYTPPIQATDGNFYGVTYGGGGHGAGVAYKMTSTGVLRSIYAFCSLPGCADGADPLGALAQGANGNLYGATAQGATHGILFELTRTGTLSILHTFDGGDGGAALAQFTLGNDGVFYGTTSEGGAGTACSGGCGTLFSVTQSGTFTSLYSFCTESGCPDGYAPQDGPLLQETNGKFYGTTPAGGANNVGTVFSFDMGLRPFVKTNPTSGPVGTPVTILGSNLTGATSVTFNGTAAAFTVVSRNEITTSVPAGATSGTVRVAAAGVTLSSNVAFRVSP
jgi:uncharacterized repeat protein (TIGR03803 family)